MPEPKYYDKATSTVVHGPAIADIIAGAADGTYALSPEGDLINDLKAKVNLILAALRSAGIIAT